MFQTKIKMNIQKFNLKLSYDGKFILDPISNPKGRLGHMKFTYEREWKWRMKKTAG